jgi:hypothetical protein
MNYQKEHKDKLAVLTMDLNAREKGEKISALALVACCAGVSLVLCIGILTYLNHFPEG